MCKSSRRTHSTAARSVPVAEMLASEARRSPHAGVRGGTRGAWQTTLATAFSQAIDRARAKTDGTVPTMGTNARMWSMRAGRLLDVSEMAKLMGLHLAGVNLQCTTESQMRKMLGMSIHVATSGLALIALLAAIGARSS